MENRHRHLVLSGFKEERGQVEQSPAAKALGKQPERVNPEGPGRSAEGGSVGRPRPLLNQPMHEG